MQKLLTFLLFSCIAISCQPKDEPELLDLLWESQYSSDSELAYTWPPVIWNNLVIYSQNDLTPGATLVAFDKTTGKKKWEWNSVAKDIYGWGNNASTNNINNGILYLGDQNWIIAIDLATGKSVYEKQYINGEEIISYNYSGCGDFIFTYSGNGQRSTVSIVQASIHDFEWKKLFTRVPQISNQIFCTKINPIIHKGDTLLFWGESEANFSTNYRNDTISLMNISQNNKFVWRIGWESLPGATPPFYVEYDATNIYFTGGDEVTCIDIETGEIKWKIKSEGNYVQGGIDLGEDHLFALINNKLVCVNVNTGIQKWSRQMLNTDIPVYHDGRVYTSGTYINYDPKLVIVNAKNGAIELEEFGPNESKNSALYFEGGISVDTLTGRIYTGDYKHALCFEKIK